MKRLLLTGAAGRIGSVLRHGLAGAAEEIRLMDVASLEAGPGEVAMEGDVRSSRTCAERWRAATRWCTWPGSRRRRSSRRSWTRTSAAPPTSSKPPAERAASGSRHLWIWLSHRDAVQLVRRSLEAPEVGFLVVYGVSANRRSWWRRDGWETIGYAPTDDAEAFADRIGDRLPYKFQGGEMAEP